MQIISHSGQTETWLLSGLFATSLGFDSKKSALSQWVGSTTSNWCPGALGKNGENPVHTGCFSAKKNFHLLNLKLNFWWLLSLNKLNINSQISFPKFWRSRSMTIYSNMIIFHVWIILSKSISCSKNWFSCAKFSLGGTWMNEMSVWFSKSDILRSSRTE